MPLAPESSTSNPSSPLTFRELVVETYSLIRAGVSRQVLMLWALLTLSATLAVTFGK